MRIEHWWNDTDKENRKYSDRNLFQYRTLCTTNPTWNGLGLNPGFCGGTAATNSQSQGTALLC